MSEELENSGSGEFTNSSTDYRDSLLPSRCDRYKQASVFQRALHTTEAQQQPVYNGVEQSRQSNRVIYCLHFWFRYADGWACIVRTVLCWILLRKHIWGGRPCLATHQRIEFSPNGIPVHEVNYSSPHHTFMSYENIMQINQTLDLQRSHAYEPSQPA